MNVGTAARCPIFNSRYAILNLRRWWPTLAWMVLIFIVSSQPKALPIPLFESLLDKLEWSDKIKHFIGYAVLGGFVWRSLGDRCTRRQRFWLAIGISAVYGATDEFHQRLVVGRSCDFCDWIADVLGASIGAMIMMIGGSKTWQTKTIRTKDTK